MTQTIDQRARELLARQLEIGLYHDDAERVRAAQDGLGVIRAASAIAALTEALTRVEELERALRPSATTKADYMGEFKFQLQRSGYDDEGKYVEWSDTVFVPWDTIKEIMAKILASTTLSKGITE